ncbi:MAG: hypothetical protein RL432_512 [Bacteroidota bacterium]|jgi:hypothetical protein
MTVKSIDINQRIPLSILETALFTLLNNEYSEDYILELLRTEFTGENRIKKALRIVNKIVLNNPLKDFLLENKDQLLLALRNRTDKNVILISLLNSAYSFSHFTLETLGKLFSAQSMVSKESLNRHIGKQYGSNRGTENALYSVIPMFLDADLFSRPKIGFYEFQSAVIIQNSITGKIYSEANNVNVNTTANSNTPYFLFIDQSRI